MNRSLLVLGITLAAALPAKADLTHKIQSSVQLEVGGASTRAIRVGNSYSISGSGVSTTDGTTAGVVGGLGAHTNGVSALTTVTPSQSQAATLSVLPTATPWVTPFQRPLQPSVRFLLSVMSPQLLLALQELLLARSTAGAVTVTAGGANTSAIGQVISELTTR